MSDVEDKILEALAGFSQDPLGFVLLAFPWGEAGTELENFSGPEKWQRQLLLDVGAGLPLNQAVQIAAASGHGVGKSALVAWLILWGISTFPGTNGVVTANTETQLKTKTWAQLAKWYRLFIGRDFFRFEATCISSRDREHEKTWRIDMVPWSERNTEAFAGLHNQGRRILIIFDEASAIPDVIWETTEGALTDKNTQIIWTVFGNPTRNNGRFKECFPGGKFSHRWKSHLVDSREVTLSDTDQINRWVSDYGLDSDFVRVRVRGMFPRVGTLQFISSELVADASVRDVSAHLHDPLIFGVDVARFGDDASVIYIRKGRDGRTHAPVVLRGADTMQVASRVAELAQEYRPDAIFVDGGGVGGGVVDRCRQLGLNIFEVQFGGKADRPDPHEESIRYANKRAEIWGYMKSWLAVGGIPSDDQLHAELTGVEYGYNGREEILLEAKQDMKKRGLSSPDIADALALTFSWPVMPSERAGIPGLRRPRVIWDYDPFSAENIAA